MGKTAYQNRVEIIFLRLAAELGTSADKILSGGKNGEAVISDISSNGTDKESPKFSHINLIPKKLSLTAITCAPGGCS